MKTVAPRLLFGGLMYLLWSSKLFIIYLKVYSKFTSVDYIDEYKAILTSSTDGSVRVWAMTGNFVSLI